MKEEILEMLSDALPTVDFDSDFLFTELDSLGVATILIILSKKYNIRLGASDATPKNLKSIDAIVNMVQNKLA